MYASEFLQTEGVEGRWWPQMSTECCSSTFYSLYTWRCDARLVIVINAWHPSGRALPTTMFTTMITAILTTVLSSMLTNVYHYVYHYVYAILTTVLTTWDTSTVSATNDGRFRYLQGEMRTSAQDYTHVQWQMTDRKYSLTQQEQSFTIHWRFWNIASVNLDEVLMKVCQWWMNRWVGPYRKRQVCRSLVWLLDRSARCLRVCLTDCDCWRLLLYLRS